MTRKSNKESLIFVTTLPADFGMADLVATQADCGTLVIRQGTETIRVPMTNVIEFCEAIDCYGAERNMALAADRTKSTKSRTAKKKRR